MHCRNVTALVLLCLPFLACSSTASDPQKSTEPKIQSTTSASAGGVAITDEMIGRSRGAMQLSGLSSDASYGYSQKSPIKIGGGFDSGSDRTYQFLNALRGPHGEALTYSRIGTCCEFKTPNSPFGGVGLLEVYEVRYAGAAEGRRLYFNWYDSAEPLVPAGLSAAK